MDKRNAETDVWHKLSARHDTRLDFEMVEAGGIENPEQVAPGKKT